MKLSVPRDSLSSALQLVGRAVSSRGTLPSLGGVLLIAGDGSLTLRATDMELALTRTLDDVTVERDGTALLPGRLFADVVRSLPPGEVSLELRPEQRDVEIAAGGARFHLRTLPAEDFPRLPELEGETVKLPARAAGRDDRARRPRGLARRGAADPHRRPGAGRGQPADDGRHRLLPAERQAHRARDSPVAQALEANVPARALRELSRIISAEGADEVEIAMPRNQAIFRAAGVALSSRLIEGQFPSWRQLIPETFEHEVRLPREEFLEITRRVSQLAQRNAPLRLAFAEGELTVAAETPDIGDASEAMPAPYTGEPLEIAFNPQFLIEGVESVGSRGARAPAQLAAAAGAAAPGRRRRLQLPRDADPAQRIDEAPPCWSSRSAFAACATWSTRRARAATRDESALGAERRRQDEPARGDLHGARRPLVPDPRRSRDDRVRRLAGAGRGGRPGPRARPTFLLSVTRGEGAATSSTARRPTPDAASLRPALSVFMPDRLALVKGPPAERRTHLDGFCAALWPARAEHAPALLARARPAQRAARPDPRRARARRLARCLGCASSRPPGSS